MNRGDGMVTSPFDKQVPYAVSIMKKGPRLLNGEGREKEPCHELEV